MLFTRPFAWGDRLTDREWAGNWKWVAAAVLLLPVLALAATEFAGVTYLNLSYTKAGDVGLAHFKDCKT